ncbi:hypothetical protein Tco_0722140 [Tanacetum coccineum]
MCKTTMTDVDVNAPAELAPTMAPPTCTGDQILPHIRWVPIGKSNCYMDVDRPQSNPIFKIAVDLLKHTNFFRAFTTFSAIPAIYIQQFWDTIRYDKISIMFTKLIIYYLQSSTSSTRERVLLLHFPNEEPVLRYLKFSSKGTKWEVFGMPISNVSVPDSPAPKPTKGAKPKTTKKPTSTQQTKPKTKPSIAKTTKSPSQPPKPKPAPANSHEKKIKRTLDAAEAPSQAKRSKTDRISKKRTLQLRDEFIDEGVPATEPRVDDEEAIVQKVLEESMKDAYPAHRGPLPPVVFREPDSGKLRPLTEVQGKGKEKRCTPATVEPSGLVNSSSLYAELGLTDSGTESDEEVSPEMSAQGQEEGQGRTNPSDAGVFLLTP